MDHDGEDTHLSGTSLVELNGTLSELGLLVKAIPSEVNESIAEVTNELVSGSWDVLHHSVFEEEDEGKDLVKASIGDGSKGSKASWDVLEGGSVVADLAWKANTSLSDKVANDGKHGDTSVLDLDVTETVETFLATVFDKAKRIVQAKWLLGTEGILESTEAGGGSSLLGWGEGSGRGDKGGKDSGLHLYFRYSVYDKICVLLVAAAALLYDKPVRHPMDGILVSCECF